MGRTCFVVSSTRAPDDAHDVLGVLRVALDLAERDGGIHRHGHDARERRAQEREHEVFGQPGTIIATRSPRRRPSATIAAARRRHSWWSRAYEYVRGSSPGTSNTKAVRSGCSAAPARMAAATVWFHFLLDMAALRSAPRRPR
jgi:hypothetical protein